MKLLKLLPLMALMIFVSCQEVKEEEAEEKKEMVEVRKPDQVMKDWISAWNNNDAKGIKDLTAKNAVLLHNGRAVQKDSVMAWIDGGAAIMKDLEINSLKKNAADQIAYEAGTYTHVYKDNDSLEVKGTYTVIWERAKNDSLGWQIRLMSIADMQEKDTLNVENN
ncbi:YybH family protein [Salegentibacter chungangensis]|uniref:YybH family protein n=1 Tax=Salegentibacter chungangensis TaxID=1335724 RepID=A0ABW3NP23_9FLAO